MNWCDLREGDVIAHEDQTFVVVCRIEGEVFTWLDLSTGRLLQAGGGGYTSLAGSVEDDGYEFYEGARRNKQGSLRHI